jgi:hypothetical protein
LWLVDLSVAKVSTEMTQDGTPLPILLVDDRAVLGECFSVYPACTSPIHGIIVPSSTEISFHLAGEKRIPGRSDAP